MRQGQTNSASDGLPKVNLLDHASAHENFSRQNKFLTSNFLFSLPTQKPCSEEALCWRKDRTTLDSILSEDAVIIPSKGILKACAMSLPDFWKSRCCLSKIEGFEHSVVNTTLGACGYLPESEEAPCLPFFVWQSGGYEFTKTRLCHRFVLWIDWVMDLQNTVVVSISPAFSNNILQQASNFQSSNIIQQALSISRGRTTTARQTDEL